MIYHQKFQGTFKDSLGFDEEKLTVIHIAIEIT